MRTGITTSTRRSGIIIVAVVVAGLVLTWLAAALLSSSDSRHTVPDVVGLSVFEATAKLENAHLRWRFLGESVIRSRSLEPEPGVVLEPSPQRNPIVSQFPGAGAAAEDGMVIELQTRCGELRDRGRGCL